jgi:hypothetical protein
MALVSPGIQISVNDQSAYVASNVGSVPLVVLATAQDKTYNSSSATGTSKDNAGKLQSFTSQRELVTAMGTPTFQLSSAGTPIHGGELNEYGLLAAYSALGLGNQLYAIRADVDLAQLAGTSVRPVQAADNETYWLDLANTDFGIYLWGALAGTWSKVAPLLITSEAEVVTTTTGGGTQLSTPLASVGQQGDHALVFVNDDGTTPSYIRLFYKATAVSYASLANTWVQVGSTDWQKSRRSVFGTTASPSNLTSGMTLTVRGTTVTTTSTTVTQLAADINAAMTSAGETGVFARADGAVGNVLTFFVTSAATSSAGTMALVDGTGTPLAKCGITAGVYKCPSLTYSTFANEPTTTNLPGGSLWWKTTSTGTGYAPSIKKYSSSLDSWVSQTAPAYTSYTTAIAGLDPTGGGVNVTHGQLISIYLPTDDSSNTLRFAKQLPNYTTNGTGGTCGALTSGNTFTLFATGIGSTTTSVTVTLAGTTAAAFVTAIYAQAVPYVTATVNSNNTITLTHTLGGQILLTNVTGTPVTTAGFASGLGSGFTVNPYSGVVAISNWEIITDHIEYSTSTPYNSPTDGTLWYYSNPSDVDIMINNSGWKGYTNVASDIRGYVLTNTDPAGVIVSPIKPTSQSDATALVAGDLWLDSSDLINYPKLSRYSGTTWVAIDNTDHVSSNGIIFADARWDTDGSSDPISDAIPDITDLLASNYLDLDAPDYRLYPRGTLLFNTRRSGYNVKKFVGDYFNDTSFPPDATNAIGLPTDTPSMTDAWVSESGLNENGSLKAGAAAQRSIVVSALQSAIDSNVDVREDIYGFNLLCAPGYPELISNLVTLNNDRADTGFIIGDTPITLEPNSIELTAWSENTNGTGLGTASAYLGVYYPAGLTNDLAGNSVVVPASHAALRTFLYNDNVSYPWFAPAGTHRGLVDNVRDVGYVSATSGSFIHNGIGQGLRDVLYSLNINPITQLPGTGLVVWGQETRSGTATSRNRINVVRLENYLRRIFKTIANGFLFEPNDTQTRKSIATQIESSLHDVLSKRGLTDFLVICDTNNNTASTIANNELYVDVAIEPMKDVEFIYIPIAMYNTGTIATLGKSST